MDDLDRPPLRPYVYEQIDNALHYVDKTYWTMLCEMRVGGIQNLDARLGDSPPSPPKRPLHLREILQAYARQLFHAEAQEYPRNSQQIKHWLSKLAARIEDRIVRSIDRLENGVRGTLVHHGVTRSEMRRVIEQALQEAIQAYPQRDSVPQEQKAPAPRHSPSASSPRLPSQSTLHLRPGKWRHIY